MEKKTSVCILGRNLYFTLGIKKLLEVFSELHGVELNFVEIHEVSLADYVISNDYITRNTPLCRYSIIGNVNHNQVFIIFHNNTQLAMDKESCERTFIIPQQANTQVFINAIMNAHCESKVFCCINKLCHMKLTPKITTREMEVMRYMSAGFNPNQISNKMNINSKCISSHKRSVMHKLGFKRNTDLYRWLREGGITVNDINPTIKHH